MTTCKPRIMSALTVTYNAPLPPTGSQDAPEPGSYFVEIAGRNGHRGVWYSFEEGVRPILIAEGWSDGTPFTEHWKGVHDAQRRMVRDVVIADYCGRYPENAAFVRGGNVSADPWRLGPVVDAATGQAKKTTAAR